MRIVEYLDDPPSAYYRPPVSSREFSLEVPDELYYRWLEASSALEKAERAMKAAILKAYKECKKQ